MARTASTRCRATADVRALSGVRYGASPVGDLAPLLAPPYDVIPESALPGYRDRSPYNVVHLTRPQGDYAEAGRLFRQWTAEGILTTDEPSIYLHEVEFGGHRRRDILAALRLDPYAEGVVLPHERTHRGPKEDRLALLRATHVALEPLWFTYEGRESGIKDLMAAAIQGPPAQDFKDPEGTRHRVWANADPSFHSAIATAFAPLPLLIADGHHRYETALAFADEIGAGPDSHSRFTLALLTDLDDPGLEVLPTHRVLKAGVAVTGGTAMPSLAATLAAVNGRVAAGVYRDHEFQVLDLEGEVAVLELHKQVIDNILGRRNPEEFVLYSRDAGEAVRWVDEGVGVQAFFLGPPDLRQVLRLAQAGKTLPQKSTYFYPKPPSGMVFMRLAEGRRL